MPKIKLGEEIDTPFVKVFFGNKHSSLENLKKEFPHFEFLRVKQTHSDVVIPATSVKLQNKGKLAEADAHYTDRVESAVVVATADCLPVMIYLPTSRLALAVHAGWRGIESNIIGKSLAHLKSRGHNVSDAQVWIGPHIGFLSFEVEIGVCERLRKSYSDLPSMVFSEFEQPHSDPKKLRINLFLIAVLQLITAGVNEHNIHSLLIDTVTSKEHESYRRDGKTAGRQLSFIAIKPNH